MERYSYSYGNGFRRSARSWCALGFMVPELVEEEDTLGKTGLGMTMISLEYSEMLNEGFSMT
jgi:hypothetical protein